jgi:hypothetical protein
MARYDKIQFEFLCAGYADEANGTVLVRNREMILEVEYPGELAYLIRGRLKGSFFSGQHEGQPEDLRVSAKWTQLDDMYIGTWVEDGEDWLFTFRLPRGADPVRGSRPIPSSR